MLTCTLWITPTVRDVLLLEWVELAAASFIGLIYYHTFNQIVSNHNKLAKLKVDM